MEKEQNNDARLFEFLVDIKRVSKVVEGGRRFAFAACVVVGNKAGSAGFAHATANEVATAKKKALNAAKKRMITISLYKNRTIYHDVYSKSGATKIMLRSAPAGTGVIAGGTAIRTFLTAVGIKDIVAKSFASSNSYNTLQATVNALKNVYSPREIAIKRGKSIDDIFFVDSKN